MTTPSSFNSPNFGFLAKHDVILVKHAALAERYVFDDANSSLIKLRQFAELLAEHCAAYAAIPVDEQDSFLSVLDYFFSTETGGVDQGNVGVGGIMRGPIPLAPEQEIAEISRRLAEAYASINEIEVSCVASETELSQLDQSILAKAFRGELVTQDPDDEPASVLLERIGESQRNQSKSIKKKTGTGKAQTNA